jgi:hypothetical protein
VIRLWHRVGMFRALAVLVLVGALAGGLLTTDRQTQQDATSTATANLADSAEATDAQGASDQRNAQTKADEAATVAAAQAKTAEDEARKKKAASRSDDRAAPSTPAGPPTGGKVGPVPASCQVYTGNRATGCTLMLEWGFTIDHAPCLVNLWNKESGWNEKASNRGSGAYGIPQALPGSKMASVGADWRTNPVTQIKWGLGYIKGRYKTPCGAWSHFQSKGWY